MNLDQKELDKALIAAAWDNDVKKSRLLIEAGADVNAKDKTVQSAYLIATSEGYLPLLELTLQHGADVKSLDSWDGTGLIRASERGHAGIVGRLLQAGIDADHVNNLGWVGLHEALEFAKPDRTADYIDTVRVLVAGGADVEIAAQRDGRTPVQLARKHGLDTQERILREAADATTVSQATANERLLAAAKRGDADAAALALRAGADLEARNNLEQTPLLLASANDHVDVARLLVALGADPDALDHQHDTPWLVTGVTGSVKMLEALLPAHPDMTIKNRFGGLSPIPAGERGHAAYIKRVVTAGVNLDHVNDLGWTALLEAVILGDGSKKYVEIVTTLVAAGVDTGIKDKDGRTALDHAKAKGYTAIVQALEKA
ncbi:ankyrin repeat domain-containing protein [Aeromicrobium panaciterrae]|uniref:ankyrin repeat domain-containing protein n=1 Tax=Aeromicrobium panaciterrae TaxID=363861 RepID=UPI0031E45613